jgi:hypothetical protein
VPMRLFVVVNALNESVPWKGKVRLDLVCGGRHNSPDARRPTQTRSRHVCAVYHQDILRWPGVTSTLISQHTHTNNLVTVVTLRMETKPDCFGGPTWDENCSYGSRNGFVVIPLSIMSNRTIRTNLLAVSMCFSIDPVALVYSTIGPTALFQKYHRNDKKG